MNYYISDVHFGHARMLAADGLDRRPFASLGEMHAAIKTRWNERVTDDDDVYILGDMAWGASEEAIAWIATLKGRKHLVLGNHDETDDARLCQLYCELVPYKEVADRLGIVTCQVVLSHYPIMFWNHQHMERWGGGLQRRWAVHLYGHVHASREEVYYQRFLRWLNEVHRIRCAAFNVGCMLPWMDYTPRTLTEIVLAQPSVVNCLPGPLLPATAAGKSSSEERVDVL